MRSRERESTSDGGADLVSGHHLRKSMTVILDVGDCWVLLACLHFMYDMVSDEYVRRRLLALIFWNPHVRTHIIISNLSTL